MNTRARRAIRVLVVDDSALMRRVLTETLESDRGLEVIAYAKDGVEALKAIPDFRPDVVTMDLELPRIDGLTCIAYIMEHFPTPVVVVTGFSEFRGEDTVKAMEYGAVGIVRKPFHLTTENPDGFNLDLTSQIRLAAQIDPDKLRPIILREIDCKTLQSASRPGDKIVAIASSTGGPRALSHIIPSLPEDFEAGVVVAQHMPALFVPCLAERLNKASSLRVKVAEHGEPVSRGKVLFVPGESGCRVEMATKGDPRISLYPIPPGRSACLISADTVMASLAPLYGCNVTGVVLTGMGRDGTEGLRVIADNGGKTIAEAEATAIVFGMPRAAIESGAVHEIVPLPEIAGEIVRMVRGEPKGAH